jgi:hypothetical protein
LARIGGRLLWIQWPEWRESALWHSILPMNIQDRVVSLKMMIEIGSIGRVTDMTERFAIFVIGLFEYKVPHGLTTSS